MNRTGLMSVLLAALITAGCTASGQVTATSSTGTQGASGTGLRNARCPVTLPSPHASPPAQLADTSGGPLPVPYISGWRGNAALWIGVPTRGILPAYPDYQMPGEWGTKFPWWRLMQGILTISARRLDGPSTGFRGEVPGGYGDAGFNPSSLIWPAPGCWQVTGTVARHSLTFVTLVKFVK